MSFIFAMTFMARTTSRHWLQMRAHRSRARRGPPALSCNQRTRGHPTSNGCPTSTATKFRTGGNPDMRTSAIVLAVAALAALPALANDTSAELSTGGLIFVRNDDVEMLSEDLAISAQEVRVHY